ncbi:hypothetical protein GGX14DRAFT_560107 [Mycena pura]|uniref:Uncharacterized protein n=1 Tax=Mycena pura TaxID=153505 RepID=A0AAD6UXI1_9AGAR|nr:hypothetical protein GGX14DRAFT_574597 [Mycena pura]KAJ7220304.1 hypothetical protein GGX14DRAFT_560107 [Mycena pura]
MSDDSYLPSSPPYRPPASSRKRQNAASPHPAHSSEPQLKKTRVKLETPACSPTKPASFSSSSPLAPRISALNSTAETANFYVSGGWLDSQTDSQAFVEGFYRRLAAVREAEDGQKLEDCDENVFCCSGADETSGYSQPVITLDPQLEEEPSADSRPLELSEEWWAEPIPRAQAYRLLERNEEVEAMREHLERHIDDLGDVLRSTEEDLASKEAALAAREAELATVTAQLRTVTADLESIRQALRPLVA